MTKQKKIKWNIPTEAIPIGYILLVCIGYAEKSVFYHNFDIDVAPYLDFEEYLFIFLPITSFFIFFILIISIYFTGIIGSLIVLIKPKKEKNNKKEKKLEVKEEAEINKKLKKTYLLRRIAAIILLTLLFASPFVVYLLQPWLLNPTIQWYKTYLIIWSITLFILFLYRTIKIQNDSDRARLYLLYAVIAPLILVFIWNYKTNKAKLILDGESKTKISFIKKDKKITTNDTIVFIGQTRNYLFLRNLKSNGNLIYKKENIDEIEIIK